MTRERPILFNGAMVRAILDGRKTQTRRIIKGRDAEALRWHAGSFEDEAGRTEDLGQAWHEGEYRVWTADYPEEGSTPLRVPYGKPGDRLWVRETHEVRLVGTETWPNGKQRHYPWSGTAPTTTA